jgi:hypothetical protein
MDPSIQEEKQANSNIKQNDTLPGNSQISKQNSLRRPPIVASMGGTVCLQQAVLNK